MHPPKCDCMFNYVNVIAVYVFPTSIYMAYDALCYWDEAPTCIYLFIEESWINWFNYDVVIVICIGGGHYILS